MKWIAALALASLAAASPVEGRGAAAARLGTTIPAHCREHTPIGGEADLDGDYRCAGLVLDFHTGGVHLSRTPQWAGQWLFVDEAGQYRLGSCTLNRGIHPSIAGPSALVAQEFPGDPTGAKRAYLTWRHGETTDDLTAAAMWAVFHHYALDAAGSTRATNAEAPLVPDLTRLSEMSGRQDLEDRALALDAEATARSSPFALDVSIGDDGTASIRLRSGDQAVDGAVVDVRVTAGGTTVQERWTTGADGVVTRPHAQPVGTVTVEATAGAPAAALLYKGPGARPHAFGPQIMITGGTPGEVRGSATRTFELPTTTTVPPTTVPSTTLPPTTQPATTTTVRPTTTTVRPTTTLPETTLPATTTVPPTTGPATTTTTSTTATTTSTTVPPITPPETTPPTPPTPPETPPAPPTVPVVAVGPPPTLPIPQPAPRLPVTGREHWTAYLGTALLVAGVGLIGTIRRRALG